MEHRRDTRIQAQVNVVVHIDDGTILMSLTRNISRGGAVIEADELAAVENKKVVWVEFIEEEIVAKVPSYVLRCTGETAAVMFITHPPALHSYLDNLMWNGNVH
jgi:PilZ domain